MKQKQQKCTDDMVTLQYENRNSVFVCNLVAKYATR